MNYNTKAGDLRRSIYNGERGEKILAAVEELIDTAPMEHRVYWKRWLATLISGRRIKIGVYPITVEDSDVFPPFTMDLVRDVESAFEGAE